VFLAVGAARFAFAFEGVNDLDGLAVVGGGLGAGAEAGVDVAERAVGFADFAAGAGVGGVVPGEGDAGGEGGFGEGEGFAGAAGGGEGAGGEDLVGGEQRAGADLARVFGDGGFEDFAALGERASVLPRLV
jgi:hypothetical protein